jgi:hypothetical protein
VSEFVEECRKEWKRLRVPDAVANEMAADLAADLKEAEADGVSAEEVLGVGAFDPRAFAASWAAERGVIQRQPVLADPVHVAGRPHRWSRMLVAVTVFALIAILGAALMTSRASTSARLAVAPAVGPLRRVVITPPFSWIPAPPGAVSPRVRGRVFRAGKVGGPTLVVPQPPFGGTQTFAVQLPNGPNIALHMVGSILLIIGIAGLILSTLFLGPWAKQHGRSPV